MTPLWTAAEAAAAIGGSNMTDWVASGVSIDSRGLNPGDIFVALRGPNRDGHDFVQAALERGAAAAIVDRDVPALPKGPPLLRVPDTLVALEALATAARARSRARIVAVTGSVGKTGTKESLRLALATAGGTYASAGGLNNHWGVPLSLARMPPDVSYGVFELGMNHPGEIAALTRLVRPHVAVITTVEPAHLGFFPSIEAIADAKAEIFLGLKWDGVAILNRDIPQFAHLQRHASEAGVSRVVSFGEHAKADARLIKCALQPHCSTVQADILGTGLTYKIGAPGRHMVLNSLAVLAVAALVGADLALAALALAELKAISGRGAPIDLDLPGGHALVIDESYNANPASVDAALALLGQAPVGTQGRRIAVLGDMLELGPQGKALHRGLVAPVEANSVDLVFCCGPLMHSLWQALPASRRGGYAEDSAGLEAQVVPAIRAGDVVMVKGSLGSRMAPIVKALQRVYPHHDTMEEASA